MDEQTDFALLYRTLGVGPECGMDELRAAYRRLAAKLHPDTGGQGEDIVRLQQLNRGYHAVTQFHRIHGRLPGEAELPGRASASTPARRYPAPRPARVPPLASPDRSLRSLMLAGVLVALVAWVADTSAPGHGPQAAQVAIGMLPSQVLAISGEPVSRSEWHWDYGPSWIAYRCGVVSDWYSSPLRPIHPGPARPARPDARGLPDRC